MLPALLVCGYATGIFSGRKIERATFDSVTFRFLSADTHPDHDSLANFRKTFLVELEAQLREEVQALLQKAAEAGHAETHDGLDLPGELAQPKKARPVTPSANRR